MKIAFVHEYLNQFGGAERLLQLLCSIYPDAPIYTLFYDKQATGHVFEGRDIRTSFLQKFPFVNTRHKFFPLLMPLAVEQFNFTDYDVVVSISASFAKGILTKPGTKHICYCLTPTRFLWDDSQRFVQDFDYNFIIKKLLPPTISYLRVWDAEAATRPDEFLAISNFVRDRISKYYRRDSEVIYPPVNLKNFYISGDIGDYFLAVGRLVAYKKFDLVIRAFNELKLPLKVVGIGPEQNNLKKIAGPNIEFLGQVNDEKLSDLYSHTQALIFPQEEDFGIIPLEALASGRPVVAYKGGGATETLNEESALFFSEQNVENLISAIKQFNPAKFDSYKLRARANLFDVEVFKDNFAKKIADISHKV